MKRENLKPVHFPGKEDCHPPKGYINWWENEMEHISTRTEIKRKYKKEIEKDLNEKDN